MITKWTERKSFCTLHNAVEKSWLASMQNQYQKLFAKLKIDIKKKYILHKKSFHVFTNTGYTPTFLGTPCSSTRIIMNSRNFQNFQTYFKNRSTNISSIHIYQNKNESNPVDLLAFCITRIDAISNIILHQRMKRLSFRLCAL